MDLSARLAPGGTRLYTLRHTPPAITLFDIERGAADPVVHWLPRGCHTGQAHLPRWEDEHHLLVLRSSKAGP